MPRGWAEAPLGEVARLRRGFDLPKHKREPGSVPVFAANGPVGLHNEIRVPGPGVVTGRSGTIGKVHFVPDDYWPLNTALYVEDFHGNDPEFITLLLRSVDLKQFGSHTAVPTLNRNVAHKALVRIPPSSEQHRIVLKVDGLMSLCDELESRGTQRVRLRERASRSCLDRLVSSRSRRDLASAWQRLSDHFEVLYDTPETLSHLRQSILQLAVQGKLVPQDPNDEPASKLLEEIAKERADWLIQKLIKKLPTVHPVANDERNGVPRGWEVARLSHVIDARFTISYGVLVPGPDTPGGIPFVRLQDLAVRNPSERPNKTIARSVEEKYARTRLVGGEILLGVVGSIGKLGIAPQCWEGANIARAVCRVAAAQQIDRHYLVIVLGCKQTQDYFIGTTRTLAQPTLNVADVKKTLIPLPPLAEQKRIVAKVDQLLSQCDELSVRLQERQSTSQQLLTATIHHLLNSVQAGRT